MINSLSRNEEISNPTTSALIPIAEGVNTEQKNVTVENLAMAINNNSSTKTEMRDSYYITFTNANGAMMKIKYSVFVTLLQMYGLKLYMTLADLREAVPTPAVGDVALVGSSLPAEVYRCNIAGTWDDSGTTYGAAVDLTAYALSSDLASANAVISDLQTKLNNITSSVVNLADTIAAKQATLKAGDNIKLTSNDDGTVTISCTASGDVKGVKVNGKKYTTIDADGIIDLGTISGGSGGGA